MIDYPTRLILDGRQGVVRHDGAALTLTAWPAAALPGVPVVEMDYTPALRACTVRESAQGWREMHGHEIRAVEAWLQRWAAACHAALQMQGAS